MARSSSTIPDVIYKDLHQDISTGKYDAGDLLPSENDLAKKYKATRFYARKALDLLEKRGFVVNKRGAGRTVTRQSSNQIKRLAIMDSHSFEYYMNHPDKLPEHIFNWQSGIYEACGSLGVTPIYLTDETKCLNDLLALLQQVIDSNVDAIICHPGFRPSKDFATFLNTLRNCVVPVMCFSELTPQDQMDYFYQDNYEVGRMLTEYAINHGHKSIGFMGARIHDENKYYRYRGYVDVMQEHGLKINDVHTVMVLEKTDVNFWQSRGKEAIETMAERGVLAALTCIICYNDQMAEGAIEELKSRGYSVPEDISIIAFDNDPRCLNYELTTGFFPYSQNVAEATKQFIKRINDNSDCYVNMSIRPQLIERKSVKDIR